MKDSTHDKIQGAVHEAKGAIKEKIDQVTKNPGSCTTRLTFNGRCIQQVLRQDQTKQNPDPRCSS